MTSESVQEPTPRTIGAWARALVLALSLLCGGFTLSLFTSTGCVGDEDFKCCECTFPSCMDSAMASAPQDVCVCTQPFTYEDCGVYCRETAPLDLWNKGLRGCGDANNSVAKNSCSTGYPVGE
jgi:hypothetical protein